MGNQDFAVKYDPEKDSWDDVTKRIFYSLFIKRHKAKKPTITFIGADSGEGKSMTYVKMAQMLLSIQGLNIRDFMDDINIYSPVEYPKKIEALLFDERLKKVNMVGIHEARDLINAKDYQNYLARTIADINAQSRSVKRLMIFIVSQFIRDITTDVRYTLTYYCKIHRPLGRKARLRIFKLWKDDRDLEKPKLRKKRIMGYLIMPDGSYRRYCPTYIEVSLPPKDIVEQFEKADTAAKSSILRRKIDKLVKEIESDLDLDNEKLDKMVSFYTTNQDSLKLIGRRGKRGFKLNSEFKKMHDLTKQEQKDFKELLDKKLQDLGIVDNG